MGMRAAIVALALVPTTALAAPVTRARFLMGTVCEVTVDDTSRAGQQTEAAFAEAARIEALLSTWRDDSELSRLNRAGGGQTTPELFALLREALGWRTRTKNAFNPLLRPLIDVWQTRDRGAVPSEKKLTEALIRSRVNVDFIEASRIVLNGGGQFEEGGFGKGYAIDRMLSSVDAPSVVINFGGQIGTRGDITVSIADPRDRRKPVIEFSITGGSLSTSSGSEKTFTSSGRTFSHIIDPRTGEAMAPRGSASAIAVRALDADILSTALYVLGPDEGLRWANDNDVAAIFITETNVIRVSAAARSLMRSPRVLDRHFTQKD